MKTPETSLCCTRILNIQSSALHYGEGNMLRYRFGRCGLTLMGVNSVFTFTDSAPTQRLLPLI